MLFDATPGTDMGLPRQGELPFRYLNRSAEPEKRRIRNLLEKWYKDYPISAQKDVKERFRSDNQDTHQSAFFELLVHAMLRKLGYDVEPHPDIPGSSRRPDFLVNTGEQSFYLEATVIGRDRRETAATAAEQDVLNKLNSLVSPYYRLTVSMSGRLTKFLPHHRIVGPFKQWLVTDGPPVEHPTWTLEGSVGEPIRIEHEDWELVGEFVPWDANKPNLPYPATEDTFIVASATDIEVRFPPIYHTLKEKAGLYNPDLPLVIAVSASDDYLPYGQIQEAQALFGTGHVRNPINTFSEHSKTPGLWIKRNGEPSCGQVASVLTVYKAIIYRLKDQRCRMYLNPWSQEHQLPKSLYVLPHATVVDGEIQWHEGRSVADLLETKKGSHIPGNTIWDDDPFQS